MNVLIVDDEINIRQLMSRYLKLEGIRSSEAENGLSAQRMLREQGFDACVIDLKMPGMNGLGLIQWIRSEGLRMPIIMISAHGEISDAVTALKEGAQDYIVKPFDPEELVLRLKKLVELQNLRNVVESKSRQVDSEGELFIGESPQIKQIKKVIEKIADTTSMVLITGESGTGKEVVARRIHQTSPVADGPFVAINIGGVPENLIESELFGYEKGAFTGAVNRKIGMFELAGGGTLFLDEIGDMKPALQPKLLRFLQEKLFYRVGGNRPVRADVRIIAATSRDLRALVGKGDFREDLFYRLNVMTFQVPPLRERTGDIRIIAEHYIRIFARRMNKPILGLADDALIALEKHPWPGNVRELCNAMERAVIFCEDRIIGKQNLFLQTPPAPSLESDPGRAAIRPLADVEKDHILRVLKECRGNQARAAALLGIHRNTLRNKMQDYGLQ